MGSLHSFEDAPCPYDYSQPPYDPSWPDDDPFFDPFSDHHDAFLRRQAYLEPWDDPEATTGWEEVEEALWDVPPEDLRRTLDQHGNLLSVTHDLRDEDGHPILDGEGRPWVRVWFRYASYFEGPDPAVVPCRNRLSSEVAGESEARKQKRLKTGDEAYPRVCDVVGDPSVQGELESRIRNLEVEDLGTVFRQAVLRGDEWALFLLARRYHEARQRPSLEQEGMVRGREEHPLTTAYVRALLSTEEGSAIFDRPFADLTLQAAADDRMPHGTTTLPPPELLQQHLTDLVTEGNERDLSLAMLVLMHASGQTPPAAATAERRPQHTQALSAALTRAIERGDERLIPPLLLPGLAIIEDAHVALAEAGHEGRPRRPMVAVYLRAVREGRVSPVVPLAALRVVPRTAQAATEGKEPAVGVASAHAPANGGAPPEPPPLQRTNSVGSVAESVGPVEEGDGPPAGPRAAWLDDEDEASTPRSLPSKNPPAAASLPRRPSSASWELKDMEDDPDPTTQKIIPRL